MQTNTREAKKFENFGLTDEQDTDDTTVIEVSLNDADLDTLLRAGVLAIPDPTVEGGVIIAQSDSNKVNRGGNVTGTPMLGRSARKRLRDEHRLDLPVCYSTAHQDGAGDSSRGTVILVGRE